MGITFILVLTAIISTVFFTGYSQRAYWNNSFWVRHTQGVLDTSYNITILFQEMLTVNYENYFSGNKNIFQQKNSYSDSLETRIKKLKYLTRDNAHQQPKIDSLNNIMLEIFQLFKSKKYQEDWDKKNLDLIKIQNNYKDKVQILIKLILQEEKRLMIIRQSKNDSYIQKLNISFCFLIGGIFILLVILYFMMQNTQEKVDDFNFKEQDYQNEIQEQEQQQINTDKAFNMELAQYNYVMSHDLKEPLRMISGFMDLLQKGYQNQLDTKANGYINYAVDGAKRMQKMINDMLKYASIGENKRKIENVNIGVLVQEIQLNLYNQIEESNCKIIIDTPTCSINVYKAEMLRLLQNLISNAIKFRKNNILSIININCVEKNTCWQISVKDNGIGIDKVFHTKIFDIFSRLHTDKEYDGTGIGLAICKKITEQHGGKIWVEAEPGDGCTFYFTISKNL